MTLTSKAVHNLLDDVFKNSTACCCTFNGPLFIPRLQLRILHGTSYPQWKM